jgi:RecB family exonuclease
LSKAARNAVAVREIVPLLFDIAASSEVFGVETSGADEWLTIAAKKDWANQPLSHYLLDLYETCPLQFKLARDWNLPAEPAAMMQFGGIMHRVLSDYYNSVMRGEAYSQAQVLEMFSDQLTSSGMEDPLQRELYAKQGAEQLERFLRESAAHPIPNVLGTEQSFEVEIAGIKVRGRIDRIDRISGDSVELIDYKTGKAKKQEDAEKSLQLAIYALAAKQQWNYNVGRIVFHNLEDNSRVETTLSAKKIASVEEKLVDAAKSMREGKFPAKPGFHCKWCGYRQLCPATEEKLHSIATASAVAVQ